MLLTTIVKCTWASDSVFKEEDECGPFLVWHGGEGVVGVDVLKVDNQRGQRIILAHQFNLKIISLE